MIKKILNDSKQYILENPKFTNLAFMIWFCRFFYITFFLAYNVNSLLTYKLEKWLSILTLFQYFWDLTTENNLIPLIIIILIIFAIWYAIWYPIWISANINFLKDNNNNIWTAITKWFKDFFSMFELNALYFSFWPYTYFSTIFKLYILDVLWNWLIIWLVIIRWLCVLFASIFRQYAKYILVLEKDKNGKDLWVFESIKKSMSLSLSNLGITFKWFLWKVRVTLLFYFKLTIIIAIPLLVIYFLATSNTIWTNSQRIVRAIWGITMIIATFLLTSTQAFFFKYRYTLYNKIKEEN